MMNDNQQARNEYGDLFGHDEELDDYEVVLGIDLKGFENSPEVSDALGNMPVFGNLFYLVNKRDSHDAVGVYVPDMDDIETNEKLYSVGDIKKCEIVFACALYTGTHEISDTYVENAHKYIEIEDVIHYFTETN